MANVITGFLNRIFNPHRNGEQYTNSAVDNLLGLSSSGQTQFDTALQTNVQEAEKNRLFQQQMVQEEREYNTPAAQMARARAAGLNPNLLYGQPISEAGSAPAGSEASVGMGGNGSFAQLLGVGRDIALTSAQIENIKSDTALKDVKSGVAEEEKLSLQYDNAMLRFEKEAYEKAAREGIIDKAIRAGFAQEINESDKSAYDVMEAAWNFLIYTGLADKENTGEYGAGSLPDTWLVYSPSALEKARNEFVGSQDAQIATYDAIMEAKKYERQSFESDNQFQEFLMEHKDEWWSKVIRGARWILREYGLPSFNVSSGSSDGWFRRNGQSAVGSNSSRHRGFSFGGMRRR